MANARKPKTEAKDPAITSTASIPRNKALTFVGLVGPSDPGGVMSGGETKWTFTAGLEAWKTDGGPVVREKLFVQAGKIGERKVAHLMDQFPNGKVVRFRAKLTRKQTGPLFVVELIQVLGQVRDRELSSVAKELNAPTEFADRVFGTLRYDRARETFEGEVSHRGEALSVWFHAGSIDEAREMVELAKPLWRSRVKWFKEFQVLARKALFDLCQSRLDADEEPLTTKEFLRLLGNPCGLDFRFDDGKLVYEMLGYSEELFGDHGVTAEGTLKDGLIDVYEG
jgi:hypothetical protein